MTLEALNKALGIVEKPTKSVEHGGMKPLSQAGCISILSCGYTMVSGHREL